MAFEQIRHNRLQAVRRLLRNYHVSSLIVTHHIDQFYVSGFSFYPQESVFVISPKSMACFTRALYQEPFGRFAPEVEVFPCDEGQLEAALAYVRQRKLSSVGFDAAKEGYLSGKKMREAGCVELPSLISSLRETKDADELKKIREACRIAYNAYEYVKPRVKTGMMECEVAAMLEGFMQTRGSMGTPFLTIVAFGENGANPHYKTGTRVLKKEDAILLDFGCIYKGYTSDISRCWWHGRREPGEYTKIWKIVDNARRTGVKTARIGTPTKQVDAATRGVIEKAGYGVYFTHRTGHGIGIENHEEPCNSPQSKAVLVAGNVFSVEPGIYLPGKFGVRLEDTVVATKTGPKIYTKK